MRQSFGSFRNAFDDGQAMKKRSVLQLVHITAGGQKRMYNRWVSITERTKLMNECKEVAAIFASLNFSVRSVSDNAFMENKDTSLKEKALLQLFRNLSSNISSSFKQWRNLNQIERMRERMGLSEKGAAIRVLEGLVHGGLNNQIRNAINHFRQNRKMVDIQRNFLKRLLVSKAGMVVIAFRKIQTLPERRNM